MSILEGKWESDDEYERWYMGCPDPDVEAEYAEASYYESVLNGEYIFGPWPFELIEPFVPVL